MYIYFSSECSSLQDHLYRLHMYLVSYIERTSCALEAYILLGKLLQYYHGQEYGPATYDKRWFWLLNKGDKY